MSNKTLAIIMTIIVISACAVLGAIIYLSGSPKNKPEEVLQEYASCIINKQYEQMYNLITEESKATMSKQEFIKRNQSIYEAMQVANFKIQVTSVNEINRKHVQVTYNNSMDTVAGNINFTNTVTLVLDRKSGYQIDWSSRLILPDLNNNEKLKVEVLQAKRGTILDRNGESLAIDGIASQISVIPGQMSGNKEVEIGKIAQLLDLTTDAIKSQLSATGVSDDSLVPLKTISIEESTLKNELLKIQGIKITDTIARTYPLGEAAAQLVGYVQTISEDELKEKAREGYTASSIIGKYGLESIYESTLRATNGIEIYIEDADGNRKSTIAKQEQKDGQDVRLTIDSKLQQEIYDLFRIDTSAIVAMNPRTGEVLALLSLPAFNPNSFSFGMTTADYRAILENPNNPLFNRYLSTYVPGSVLTPVIGAIGLTNKSFTAEEDFGQSGTRWQNDNSWGKSFVTNTATYEGTSNLSNALTFSDNIYFGKAALKIGRIKLRDAFKNIGFGEEIKFTQTMDKSSFSNTGEFKDDLQLANSGYGQGEVVVNPIHMAMMYTSFVNEGNMVMPYLEYKENGVGTYYKKNVFSREAADTIRDDLIQAVENPSGLAHLAQIGGKTIAGKIGTAEVKSANNENQSTQIGWFNALSIEEDYRDSLLIVSMVENIDNKGGSQYLLQKVKTIFANRN